MAFANILLIFFLSSTIAVVAVNGNNVRRKIFDVMRYGAVADGRTDNGPAFLKAWKDACAYPHGKRGVLIPRGIYMTGSVTFSGGCKGPIAFLLQGTLRAPTDPSKFFGLTWIGFRYVNRLTLTGGGTLDGQGPVAWKYNNCTRDPSCKPLPTSLRFDFVTNSSMSHVRSMNSKNTHINIFASSNISISNVKVIAPGNSPNTDGIKIAYTDNIKISDSIISTGDDCVAIIAGTKNVNISGVACGPGHGISIGSIGRGKVREKEYVMGVSVRNCSFFDTQNGVRVKTWAPSLSGLVSDLSFQDIYMRNVSNPIIIDQNYCPNHSCKPGEDTSSVQVQNVLLKHIWGTSLSQVALNLHCSRIRPCKNVNIFNIKFSYINKTGGTTKAIGSCAYVFGMGGCAKPDTTHQSPCYKKEGL